MRGNYHTAIKQDTVSMASRTEIFIFRRIRDRRPEHLDNLLAGETIVNNIVQKVNTRLKFLYRQYCFLNEKLRKSVCSALIQCHLDHACSSWYDGLSKTLKEKLQTS